MLKIFHGSAFFSLTGSEGENIFTRYIYIYIYIDDDDEGFEDF